MCTWRSRGTAEARVVTNISIGIDGGASISESDEQLHQYRQQQQQLQITTENPPGCIVAAKSAAERLGAEDPARRAWHTPERSRLSSSSRSASSPSSSRNNYNRELGQSPPPGFINAEEEEAPYSSEATRILARTRTGAGAGTSAPAASPKRQNSSSRSAKKQTSLRLQPLGSPLGKETKEVQTQRAKEERGAVESEEEMVPRRNRSFGLVAASSSIDTLPVRERVEKGSSRSRHSSRKRGGEEVEILAQEINDNRAMVEVDPLEESRESVLSGGWETYRDDTGKPYYFNSR